MSENFPRRNIKKEISQLENKEKKVLWRGTIGFDFIFIKDFDENGIEIKKPICVELNGSESGVLGIENIRDEKIEKLQKVIAGIRARKNPKMYDKYTIANTIGDRIKILGKIPDDDVIDHLELGFSTPELTRKVERYVNNSLQKVSLFHHANKNPEQVKEICDNKRLQQEIIPDENKPRMWVRGVNEKSRSGYWIMKPLDGVQGKDIHIFDDEQMKRQVELFGKISKLGEDHIETYNLIQEFLFPLGADNAGGEKKNNASSMRLLLDFAVLPNGNVEVEEMHSYQRVSPYEPVFREPKAHEYVVNKSRGALSYGASKEENDLVMPVAIQIIKNLTPSAMGPVQNF